MHARETCAARERPALDPLQGSREKHLLKRAVLEDSRLAVLGPENLQALVQDDASEPLALPKRTLVQKPERGRSLEALQRGLGERVPKNAPQLAFSLERHPP